MLRGEIVRRIKFQTDYENKPNRVIFKHELDVYCDGREQSRMNAQVFGLSTQHVTLTFTKWEDKRKHTFHLGQNQEFRYGPGQLEFHQASKCRCKLGSWKNDSETQGMCVRGEVKYKIFMKGIMLIYSQCSKDKSDNEPASNKHSILVEYTHSKEFMILWKVTKKEKSIL